MKLLLASLLLTSFCYANKYMQCEVRAVVNTWKGTELIKQESLNPCLIGSAIVRFNEDGSDFKTSCSAMLGDEGPNYDFSIVSSNYNKALNKVDFKFSLKTKFDEVVSEKDFTGKNQVDPYDVFILNFDNDIPFERVSTKVFKTISTFNVDCRKNDNSVDESDRNKTKEKLSKPSSSVGGSTSAVNK